MSGISVLSEDERDSPTACKDAHPEAGLHWLTAATVIKNASVNLLS